MQPVEKKKEKYILKNDIREKKYNEMSCYLQCNSAKPAVRQNHSTPQQMSVSRTEANLVFMNVKYAAVKATPVPNQPEALLIFQNKSFQYFGKYL